MFKLEDNACLLCVCLPVHTLR